uniref:Uncharacterized protein n=1 Tax=viral metagenome TaxID=1070528 RepID=A0A6H2A5E7_9ZZZZ
MTTRRKPWGDEDERRRKSFRLLVLHYGSQAKAARELGTNEKNVSVWLHGDYRIGERWWAEISHRLEEVT